MYVSGRKKSGPGLAPHSIVGYIFYVVFLFFMHYVQLYIRHPKEIMKMEQHFSVLQLWLQK